MKLRRFNCNNRKNKKTKKKKKKTKTKTKKLRRKWRLGSCVQEFDHKLLAFGRLAGCKAAADGVGGGGGGGGVDTQERSESESVDERSLAFI
jgi:hypothetical protein